MKTINRSNKNDDNAPSQKSFVSRYMYWMILAGAVLAIGAVVTLTLVLGRDNDNPTIAPPPPVVSFVLPVENGRIVEHANLTQFVFNPSINRWATINGTVFGVEDYSPVVAVFTGTVTDVQDTMLEGVVITIDHGDGLIARYVGLSNDTTVEVGKAVEPGTVIGATSTNLAQFAHHNNLVYLEMRQGGRLIDPMTVLPQEV